MTKERGRVLPISGAPSGVSFLWVTNYNRATQNSMHILEFVQRNHTVLLYYTMIFTESKIPLISKF